MGRNASRDSRGPRCEDNHEIVERDLREFEGSRLALRLRGFDAAIAVTVEMRARRRRRALHAVVRVMSGSVRRVDARQRAGAHGTGPSHCNGEGRYDDRMPVVHK